MAIGLIQTTSITKIVEWPESNVGVKGESLGTRIPSHRAMTTIACQLYNAKESLSPLELQG